MTKRIEYIDAMRGFTMLLVVYSHILLFGYSDLLIRDNEILSFNRFFLTFRMPLFFLSVALFFLKRYYLESTNLLELFKEESQNTINTNSFFLHFICFPF